MSSGCAAVQHAGQIDETSVAFLQSWQQKKFAQMYNLLHPSFQQQVSRGKFVLAFERIDSVIGRLVRYKNEAAMGWRPPLINERMFADPLPSETSRAVNQFHVYFVQSEGSVLIELGRKGDQEVRIVGLGLTLPELHQSPLREELRALDINL